ncbi:hypothetical protein PPERSA_08908 [Pseudocohnilembus persalinus]|uniref:Uncharacterized protein n=1 Tax=Pseudocohnilembus persalinus TaxID=266149 RepID=A0A0V0R2S8_PSEPJ|nr:hypothetical protein PPERSA_08908 [Pseudocohnilembus persalinus]|eukprot:KRX08804.1 hypothetical protein PPERSA_08908 [Pseudocohnilembus persalinus]
MFQIKKNYTYQDLINQTIKKPRKMNIILQMRKKQDMIHLQTLNIIQMVLIINNIKKNKCYKINKQMTEIFNIFKMNLKYNDDDNNEDEDDDVDNSNQENIQNIDDSLKKLQIQLKSG